MQGVSDRWGVVFLTRQDEWSKDSEDEVTGNHQAVVGEAIGGGAMSQQLLDRGHSSIGSGKMDGHQTVAGHGIHVRIMPQKPIEALL